MAKSHYVPKTDDGKVTWLNNFSSKLPDHASVLGLSPEQITSVQNDAAMFSYIVNLVNSFKTGLAERVGYKDLLKNGAENSPLGPAPVYNNTPAPTVVPAGIFVRISKLIMTIKGNPNYTEAIGNNLGIIGSEENIEFSELKPVINIKMEAGYPKLIWKKGKADSIDIYVDRSDGKGFVYLANDSSPDFVDKASLNGNEKTAAWVYKAIYRVKDEQVGLFSDDVSVTVKKEIT
ncbi:MAG TPA: hypothetical protein PKA90_16990 [Ignavibacteria bacterium]|nr:hypothetical protein [Ignavibacteria bacterium]HMR42115.1 hypothetical protein [Ignavibacteria bacterium]